MPPTQRLVEFALLSYVLVLVPGPNVLFVISRSLQLGRLAGVTAVVGGQLGVYPQVILVAVTVGALVQESAAVFTLIKLAGAAYIIFLVVQASRHRQWLDAVLAAEVQRGTPRRRGP